jgi:hypothetical protein
VDAGHETDEERTRKIMGIIKPGAEAPAGLARCQSEKAACMRKPLYDKKQLDSIFECLEILKFMILEANRMTGGVGEHPQFLLKDLEFNWEKHGHMVLKDLEEKLVPFNEFLPKVHPHYQGE